MGDGRYYLNKRLLINTKERGLRVVEEGEVKEAERKDGGKIDDSESVGRDDNGGEGGFT